MGPFVGSIGRTRGFSVTTARRPDLPRARHAGSTPAPLAATAPRWQGVCGLPRHTWGFLGGPRARGR